MPRVLADDDDEDFYKGEKIQDWPIFKIAWYYHVIVFLIVVVFNGTLYWVFGRSAPMTICFPVPVPKVDIVQHELEEANKNFNKYPEYD